MRTEGYFFLAAVAIHGALLLVARAMPPLTQLEPSDQRELRVIDIELPSALPMEVREPPPLPANLEPTRPADPSQGAEARLARGAAAPAVGPQGVPSSEPGSPEANPAPPGPADGKKSDFDELPPEQRSGVLGVPGVPGLGGPGVWSMPGVLPGPGKAAAAPTVAPAPREVPRDIGDRVLGDAIAAHDKDIGLDLPMAGNMSSAARSAVMSSAIPTGTRGTIECRVSPSGAISNCRLVSSTGGGDGWASAVAAAQGIAGAALQGQYARGALVSIDISVVQTPPAGSKGGFSGAGANFDVSNLGAHTTRMVRVSHHVVAMR